MVIGVEAFSGQACSAVDIAFTQLGRAAGNKMMDPALRLHSLVEVLVARQNQVDFVRDEQRLQQRPKRGIRAVPARRVQRVMKEAYLPVAARARELLLEPLELRFVHVVAIQREEANSVLWFEGVESLAAHIEEFVPLLDSRLVMIS